MGYMSLRVSAARRGQAGCGPGCIRRRDDQDRESAHEPDTGHSGLRPGWAWSARTARLGLRRAAARASAGARCLLAAPAAARAAIPARPGWHATARRAAAGPG